MVVEQMSHWKLVKDFPITKVMMGFKNLYQTKESLTAINNLNNSQVKNDPND